MKISISNKGQVFDFFYSPVNDQKMTATPNRLRTVMLWAIAEAPFDTERMKKLINEKKILNIKVYDIQVN